MQRYGEHTGHHAAVGQQERAHCQLRSASCSIGFQSPSEACVLPGHSLRDGPAACSRAGADRSASLFAQDRPGRLCLTLARCVWSQHGEDNPSPPLHRHWHCLPLPPLLL